MKCAIHPLPVDADHLFTKTTDAVQERLEISS